MSSAIQLTQSAVWLGQMPVRENVAATPIFLILLLGALAIGFLVILLAAIFGRWKALAALLFFGVFGLIAMALLSFVAIRVETRSEVSDHYGHRSAITATRHSQVAVEAPRRVTPKPPIELPASPASPAASPKSVVKAVGDALFNTFVQPAVSSINDARSSSIIPPGRPAWVDQEPESRDGVDYVSVSTGPYTSSTECYKALKVLTNEAVAEQAALVLGSETNARRVPLDEKFIADNVHLQTYKESLDTSVGPMQQWHSFLQFNEQFRRELESRWKQVQQLSRLTYAGALFAGILTVLGVLYGALSYNSATGGRYRARLQTIAGAAIMGVVGGAILLTQWYPPI
ncbi:hypothetical protein M4951_24850 [Blastopirellula sp. J2-11]|uniref:hypothetical protein n=1 Tax=Blastopirellula sp. J2-11 TaxID=2943192 RepID=UPI0021C7E9D0|nr:hypothetical protein [Blastopirellula sp. J2-11]UUO06560.1 hypothetical protein M4951_24850 [Blastopirellula sp. J2-11]